LSPTFWAGDEARKQAKTGRKRDNYDQIAMTHIEEKRRTGSKKEMEVLRFLTLA